MSKNHPLIYVGCALTQAPKSFVKAVEALKDDLKLHYDVIDFLGLSAGTPQHVYHQDIEVGVTSCDLFVAICDYPSIGLGYEIATAVEKLQKPTLAVAKSGVRLTRLLEGIGSNRYALKRYQDLSDVPAMIAEALQAQIN